MSRLALVGTIFPWHNDRMASKPPVKPRRRGPVIRMVVQQLGGIRATARVLGIHSSQIDQWIARGWASPMHYLKLEKHLPAGMTLRDLDADRQRAKRAA